MLIYRGAQSRLTVVSTRNTEFILVFLFIRCTISHVNSCKPTFAHPYILVRVVPASALWVILSAETQPSTTSHRESSRGSIRSAQKNSPPTVTEI